MDSFKLFQSYNNLKFLLSFSFFFLLFSLFPLLSQSLKPFLMQFFSYNIDKSYMFLLCNTLLAFIALYSSLFNNNTSSSITPESEKINRFEYYISESEITEPIVDDNIMVSESPQKEEEEKSLMIVEEPESVVIEEEEDDDDDDGDHYEEGNALMIIDGDDETEELNKKCEDFIKKMKAVFCSDSRAENSSYFDYYQNQKSLVLVN
ncbi:uncharacterized protein LOC123921930 [Trifolium pratense]|uniref:uncharacterized protein LOC123921930 n=1 Tax=Trifolium pratense TaxID=57577 RepID=UPI001E696C30|nr:uncharacterized protein LOC123921930 [Trifolium pratense]